MIFAQFLSDYNQALQEKKDYSIEETFENYNKHERIQDL